MLFCCFRFSSISFIRAYAMQFVLLLPSTFLVISIFSFSIGWWCLNVTFLLCVCAYRLWFDFFDYSLLISIPWQPCIRRHLYRPVSVWLWQFDQHDLSFLLCHCVLVGWLVGWWNTRRREYDTARFFYNRSLMRLFERVCMCMRDFLRKSLTDRVFVLCFFCLLCGYFLFICLVCIGFCFFVLINH